MSKTNPIDKQNLRQIIIDSPKQFSAGFLLAKKIKLKKKFTTICISGMGGSSLPADLLRTYLDNLFETNPKNNQNLEIIQNKDYTLPAKTLTDNCLHIFSSYSGNTEETLSALTESIEKKLFSLGITHGGKLQKICTENKIPYILLPAVIQPRYATGYFFAAILQLLINQKLIEDISQSIIASTKKLEKLVLQLEKEGRVTAQKIAGKTPIIYTSDKFKSIALVTKIKINENAKTPCFYNYYPELNHNEMVGYSLPQANFQIINLIDFAENPQIIKRMQITAKLLHTKKIATTFFEIKGNNFFEKIFSTLLFSDWLSYYLALEYKQDPTPVNMVKNFKLALI